jgi:hypothetical protein
LHIVSRFIYQSDPEIADIMTTAHVGGFTAGHRLRCGR